jgi:hypothetical protein
MDRPGMQRRGFLMAAAAATSAVAAGAPRAQGAPGSVQTDNAPKELAGKPMPEPSPSQSSGPVAPGRGSNLSGKVAVVTGAARGIGRAIAVEMAANGADIVAVDIAGPVSSASNAVPATPEELEETAKMIRALGRRAETVRADIRDIAALRRIADQTEQHFGKVDIVVANAAIQRWKPLLEVQPGVSERDGRIARQGDREAELEAAQLMIAQSRHPIDVVARETGFGDQERMRRAFIRALGQSPQALRRVAAAERAGLASVQAPPIKS